MSNLFAYSMHCSALALGKMKVRCQPVRMCNILRSHWTWRALCCGVPAALAVDKWSLTEYILAWDDADDEDQEDACVPFFLPLQSPVTLHPSNWQAHYSDNPLKLRGMFQAFHILQHPMVFHPHRMPNGLCVGVD